MTKNIYMTERFDKEHRHFGGLILPSDFNTDYRGKDNTKGSTVAQRIESDFRLEYSLRKNQTINELYKKKGF